MENSTIIKPKTIEEVRALMKFNRNEDGAIIGFEFVDLNETVFFKTDKPFNAELICKDRTGSVYTWPGKYNDEVQRRYTMLEENWLTESKAAEAFAEECGTECQAILDIIYMKGGNYE